MTNYSVMWRLFHKPEIRILSLTNQYFNGKSPAVFVFFVPHLFWTFFFSPQKIRQAVWSAWWITLGFSTPMPIPNLWMRCSQTWEFSIMLRFVMSIPWGLPKPCNSGYINNVNNPFMFMKGTLVTSSWQMFISVFIRTPCINWDVMLICIYQAHILGVCIVGRVSWVSSIHLCPLCPRHKERKTFVRNDVHYAHYIQPFQGA